MDKKAFHMAMTFMRRNFKIVLLLIVLMFGIAFGEMQLSKALQEAGLRWADVVLAVIRMFLQASLSMILVFLWHRQHGSAAPFAVTDLLKLFVPNLLVTILLSFCVALIVTIPLAVWLYLRLDFYMNEYVTGRADGMLSCIGSSFRHTKQAKTAGKYLVFNLKFLLFYFVIDFVLTGVNRFTFPSLSANVLDALDVIEMVFVSVFMPYRFLIKCGFYEVYLQETKES